MNDIVFKDNHLIRQRCDLARMNYLIWGTHESLHLASEQKYIQWTDQTILFRNIVSVPIIDAALLRSMGATINHITNPTRL